MLAPVHSRDMLGDLLVCRGLTTAGVEVGTHRGEYAEILLRTWPGRLLCVDPWSVPPGYERQAKTLWGGPTRADDEAWCRSLLSAHIGACRVLLVKATSAEAVKAVADGSLDFAYLDGDHERPGIDDDLRWWWPKVRHGGVLAGHDFLMPGESDGLWGRSIQPAVMGFAAERGVDVHLMTESNGLPWSWIIFKPERG